MVSQEQMRAWIEAHQSRPQYLADIETRVADLGYENEQIFLSQAYLLRVLVTVSRATRILELGTFFGYSTAVFVRILEESGGGTVFTVDRDRESIAQAQELVPKSDLVRVTYCVGDATATCEDLIRARARFDLVLLDVDEAAYAALYPLCIDLLADRGVLVIDNILMPTVEGWDSTHNVIEGSSDDKLDGLRRTLKAMNEDRRVEVAVVPLGSGMAICTKPRTL